MNRRTALALLALSAGPMARAAVLKPGAGARPGPRNAITDVAGIQVGQAQDPRVRTGVTVIVPDRPALAAVDVRGGAPGTRETDLLEDPNLVHAVDAVVLAGGSVYGLAAADGVAAWLGARGRGFAAVPSPGVPTAPIVPAAILFDLANGGDKGWGEAPPYRELGKAAVASASPAFLLGTAGAGYGAYAGALKGGIGSASIVTGDGITIAAIVAVNSLGSVVAADCTTFWAAPYEIADEFGGGGSAGLVASPEDWLAGAKAPAAGRNTTIGCIATDAALRPAELKRVAIMAQDGLARAIRPVHTLFDGDVVFALSTGRRTVAGDTPALVSRIGALAADTMARAIARAVHAATPPADAPRTRIWRKGQGCR